MTSSAPIAVLTGITGTIGKEIARGLVTQGWKVIAPVRDQAKGQQVVKELVKDQSKGSIVLEELDTTSKQSIKDLADRLAKSVDHIDVLINNAAASPPKRELTKEGIEMQLSANVLSYHRISTALYPLLKRAATPQHKARIVNVASRWAGNMDLDDLQFTKRPYDSVLSYQQSKQANRMWSWEASRRFAADNITVNACHPGWTPSKLSADLNVATNAPDSAAESAATPLYAATSPELEGVTGKWLNSSNVAKCEWANDVENQKRLWDICESFQ